MYIEHSPERDKRAERWTEATARGAASRALSPILHGALPRHASAGQLPAPVPSRKPNRKSFFHRVPAPVDGGAAAYMPYDEVTFPKLDAAADPELAPRQLDGMWMVGLMDHERQR